MTNVHRLQPMPKMRRHGEIACRISDEINVRELAAALASAGLMLTHNGMLRIERSKRSDTK
jgi:hypothetical protein